MSRITFFAALALPFALAVGGCTPNPVDPACGNGLLDTGEACDPAIASGPGVCPASCNDGNPGTVDVLEGSPGTCTAVCTHEPVRTCQDGDSFCPAGCTQANDDDCAPVCGNGIVEGDEVCDGECPTSCNDRNPCTVDVLEGHASQCNAVCIYTSVETCGGGDACCPGGCNASNDSDCSTTCGNGIVEGGETCDGDCVESCDDGVACTTDVVTGSAANCNVSCLHQPIRSCQSGDGCCPAGCTSATDSDCSATCGDGILDPGETCDGNCPVTCNDGSACTIDVLSGSATSCTASCSYQRVDTCVDGDGCCPAGCSSLTDSDCSSSCGNGIVEGGETCDGDCLASCDDGNACTGDLMTGSAENCNVGCSYTSLTECRGGDGCCPAGCTSTTDSDCSATCGNGSIDPGESCDGDCPTTCNDGNACTLDGSTGAASTCNLVCTHQSISQCQDGDGCCPSGCSTADDSDCSVTCGNGIVETGETCDGDCPTTCDDGDACTLDSLTGSAGNCNVSCSYSTVTACNSNDGCCPSGCTYAEDTDCACQAGTCASLSVQCGTASDGCGGTLDCGGCNSGETCVGNVCQVSEGTLGDPCAQDADCLVGLGCIEVATDGWTGGYCSKVCTGDSQCGSSSGLGHCGFRDISGGGICLRNCSTNGDCRSDYQCFNIDADVGLVKECAPVGSGSGGVGAPCVDYADCSGGQGAACATQANGFKDGYCTTLSCSASTPCPAGSHCGFIDSSTGRGACVKNCATNTDCRGGDGYLCFDADGAGVNECYSAATGTRAVGNACTYLWECSGGRYGYCAGAADWPGGYCTVACGTDGTSCPAGSGCVEFDDTDGTQRYCLDVCSGAADCRSGYQCNDVGGTTAMECNPL